MFLNTGSLFLRIVPVCGIVPWKAIRPFHRTFISYHIKILSHQKTYENIYTGVSFL